MANAAERPTVVQGPHNGFVFGKSFQWNKPLIDPVQMQHVIIQLLQDTVNITATEIGHEDVFAIWITVPTCMLEFVLKYVTDPIECFVKRIL